MFTPSHDPATNGTAAAAAGAAPVRALVAASVRLYRDGLAHSLGESAQVVAVTADAAGALREAVRHAPDVALLDVSMEGGLQLVRVLAARVPETRVVAFAVDEGCDERVLACVEAGAAGWVGRDATVDEVVDAVHRAARGELHCSARMAGLLSKRVAALARDRGGPRIQAARLTPREHEVGSLLSRGLSNKHIARTLGLQVATVKNHVHNILEKMGAPSRGEAAVHLRGGAPADE
jgi:two-component system, NarL family, nitrate/nitrite response regulator NarL